MGLLDIFKDARKKKSRDFAQELSYQFMQSPMCSDYENLFAQIRPLVDEMKMVFPYGITERGAKLNYKRTPEIDVLHNPNDDMGWAEFADAMFCTWLTENELDIHVHFNGNKIIGYTILPPQSRMYLGNGMWQWNVMTTKGEEVLTEDEVMRLRFSRSPRDLQRGVSPASAVRAWAQIDDLISQYQKAYFENGAIPATITFITASTEEKYRRTREELENKLRGAKNRNKTVYAWRQFDNGTGQSADQIEVKTIQGSNSTLAIKDIISIINDRLNKSVGVSNFILGDDSSAKYDNAELSDHQFTKRRVYPALMSFWNQFQHELERIIGGLGYGITFDLEIPELTEKKRAYAEINRIRSETLVNLISAGASATSAVKALELGKDWEQVAVGIYANKLAGNMLSPLSIDYEKPKAKEATVDNLKEAEVVEKKDLGHKCTCKHTLDALPPMSEDEKQIYDLLVALANQVKDGKEVDVDKVIAEMKELLEYDAKQGAEEGIKALELLTNEDVANELAQIISNGEVYISRTLSERLNSRASQLVKGYHDYTKSVVEEVLTSSEGMTANEIKQKLAEVLPESRAELIARNETVYAIKSGRLEQDQDIANKYGLKMKLVWRTSHDANVCDLCAAMDGQEVTLGDAFTAVETEDGQTWEPNSWNDHGMIPDAHVNCRCYFDEVVE